jgi:uncharacterized membrane protein YciS (DUF1049 family)
MSSADSLFYSSSLIASVLCAMFTIKLNLSLRSREVKGSLQQLFEEIVTLSEVAIEGQL